MRNAEAGRLISRGSLGVVTGERPEIARLTGSFGGGPLEKGRKVPRWRPTLLHEQFLGGWAGAIPPGYPALGRRTVRQRVLILPTWNLKFSTEYQAFACPSRLSAAVSMLASDFLPVTDALPSLSPRESCPRWRETPR